MKISVIIPTHNRCDLLPRAIKSVQDQTFKDLEIIVVSDGSTDDTDEVMKKLAEEDPRINYISYHPGRNGNYARNTGIKASKGEYIAFLDDDDEWLPTKLEEQLKVMESDEKIGLVYTGTHSIYADDGIEYDSFPKLHGDMSKQVLYSNFAGSTTTVMLRKSILDSAGLFDEKLPAMQDYDLWIRICQIAKVGVVSTPLVNYYNYNNSGQISANFEKYEYSYAYVNKKYEDLFKKLTPYEMRRKLSGQKISIGKKAFRIGESKIARRYYLESMKICFRRKTLFYYFLSFLDFKFLLKIRSLK